MKNFLALVLLFAVPASAQIMGVSSRKVFTATGGIAIAFDQATSQQTNVSGLTTLTYSATVGSSGTNRFLFVGVWCASSTATPTVNYAGSAMTMLKNQSWFFAGGRVFIFGIVAPTTGTNSVVITYAVAPSGNILSSAASYTGVLQSITPDASTGATAGAAISTSTLTLTTIANNCWTFVFAGAGNGIALSAGAGSTLRTNSGVQTGIFDSNGPKTPAGSTSQSITLTPAGQFGGVMVSFTHA